MTAQIVAKQGGVLAKGGGVLPRDTPDYHGEMASKDSFENGIIKQLN